MLFEQWMSAGKNICLIIWAWRKKERISRLLIFKVALWMLHTNTIMRLQWQSALRQRNTSKKAPLTNTCSGCFTFSCSCFWNGLASEVAEHVQMYTLDCTSFANIKLFKDTLLTMQCCCQLSQWASEVVFWIGSCFHERKWRLGRSPENYISSRTFFLFGTRCMTIIFFMLPGWPSG